MAGPLSSEEIEDVVSSVRRLVSNELSPRRLSRDLGADRLLLTPSLRVVSEVSPLAPLVLDERSAEADTPGPALDPAHAVDAGQDDAVELIEAEWEDELWVAPEAAPLGEVALAADDAELLQAVADAMEADAVDPVAAEASDGSAVVPLRRRAEDLAARLAAGSVVETPQDETAPGKAAPADEAETADLAQSAEKEPDPDLTPEIDAEQLEETAALSEDLVAAQDSAPTRDPDVPPPEVAAQRMPTEIIDADGTPLAVLDEAALQEIVRQMIREELQGDLGERITRNVRKLVRAEINRALIARDLD
jgi:hypothetical protein